MAILRSIHSPMDTEDFLATALRNPVNDAIAEELFRLALPDAWIVSGCLVQTVWNVLTSRPIDHGINDYDIFYFDPDTLWQAEDAVIRELQGRLEKPGVKIEVRNQARVHLWYPEKHGLPYPALQSSTQGIDRFLTRNTQVGIRRRHGGHDVHAPNGFDDIANMIVRPNPGPNFSAANYEAKTRRWKMCWPEITVLAAGEDLWIGTEKGIGTGRAPAANRQRRPIAPMTCGSKRAARAAWASAVR